MCAGPPILSPPGTFGSIATAGSDCPCTVCATALSNAKLTPSKSAFIVCPPAGMGVASVGGVGCPQADTGARAGLLDEGDGHVSSELPHLAGILALPFTLTSCHHYEPAMFNRGVGIESESVLVIPFSEPQKKRWYTESDRGQLAAEAFKVWAYKHAEPEFPDPESMQSALKVVRNWDRPKITGKDWQKIATG